LDRHLTPLPTVVKGRPSSTDSWVKGFHGTVQGFGLDGVTPMSARELALSHRSLGVQRMATLTELPVAATVLPAEPPGTAIGDSGATDDLDPDWGIQDERWDRTEPLSTYIDRRLATAHFLLLPNRSRSYAATKRVVDIVGALLLLLLTLPIIAILVVLIRMDSPGPAIFRQERVTRGGQTFQFYKFRTMWVDAKERYPDLYSNTFANDAFHNAFYKMPDDPRNTGVGRWLRRTTLDELPNLFNVLKGDLSLIGPRPELPDLVQYYRPEELACFFTKAGLSGLAQVAGRSLLTVRERLALDLRYVAHQTLLLDLRIMWRTVLVVAVGRGAF
jgi:lipopolysaccharide/colanic/teichoic acid biosynthesis glycosyltransferase